MLSLSPPAWWEHRYHSDPPEPAPSWLLTYDDGTEDWIEVEDLPDVIRSLGAASFTLSLCI